MRTEPTRILGLIGNPIKYSLSPVIFKYLFRKYEINACYKLFPLKLNQLRTALEGMKIFGIRGVNVTAPYKEKVIQFLDSLDESARKVRAVNVIVNLKGKLVGFNTDIIGIKRTLEEKLHMNSGPEQVLLIGAGGAARACLSVLTEFKPKKIVLANRTLSRAEALSRGLNSNFNSEVMELSKLKNYLEKNKAALLINAASAENAKIKGAASHILTGGGRVFDLKYYQGNNSFAQSQKYSDGLYMLACQAAESFKIWFGIRPDAEEVYRYLLKKGRRHIV